MIKIPKRRYPANYETRLVRILKVVRMLENGKVYTREIAQEFGCSMRTAERYFNDLEKAGWAIYNKPIGQRACWYWEKIK